MPVPTFEEIYDTPTVPMPTKGKTGYGMRGEYMVGTIPSVVSTIPSFEEVYDVPQAESLLTRFGKQLYNVGVVPVYKTFATTLGDIAGTLQSIGEDIKILPRDEKSMYDMADEIKTKIQETAFPVKPAETLSEKFTDVGAGLTSFIGQLALTRRILPAGTPEPIIWEIQNLATEGTPGMGALLGGTLGAIGKIPASQLAKTSAETALFYSLGKAQGLEEEDLWIQTALPIALRGVGLAKKGIRKLVTPVTPTPKEVSQIIERAARPPEITPTEAVKLRPPAEPTVTPTIPPERPPAAAQAPETSSVTRDIPPQEPPEIGKITPRPVPPKGKFKERKFVTSVKEEFPEMETRVSGLYMPRSTDKLSMQAKNLIRDNIDVAENYARKNANDKAIAITCELIKHYNKQANLTTDIAVKNTLYDKAADIANLNARQLTELGRSVQAASILGRLTPEGQLRFASKIIDDYNARLMKRPAGLLGLQKRVPNLTTEQTKEILTRAKTIQNMPDGAEKAMAWWGLQNHISDLVPVPLYRSIIDTWRAGLLTGIKTHGLNTLSNLFHGATESIKDIPGVAVDRTAALFTGERTLALTGRGLYGGTKKGIQKGWQYLKTGYDERRIGVKYDWRKGSYGKSRFARWIQAYDETVFELMGAEDQPFYYGAKSRSLYSQAAAKAINKGLKGTERKTFIDNLVQNPTDEMIKYATIDAEIAVYQNKTMLGDIARGIQRVPGGEIIVPFSRTPSAVAMQIINYSPIGIPKTIIQNIGKGRFDQRLFSQGIGRGMTGTAVLAIGVALYKAGLITLDRPQSEREQKLWELEGRQANSIKVGDEWRTVQTFGPAGNLLIIGGHFQNALENSGSFTEAIVKTLAGTAKTFSEQTFVRGVNMSVEALQDPERSFEVWFSGLAGSTVPTIIADTARAMDSVERRTVGPVQKIKGRIPVLRESLEPRVNVFGQDLPRYGGNSLEIMIDPTRPVKIKQDVVVDELRRLWNVKIKVSPTLLGDKTGYEELTAEQNTHLWYRAGQLTYFGIFNLMQLPEYKKVTDEEKGKLIESFVDDAKNIARAEMVLEATNQLSDLQKLIELRKTGLLTAEVGRLLALTRMDMTILTQLSQVEKTTPQPEPILTEQPY